MDRLWVDFPAGSGERSDVVVRNESKDRYYISVVPSEIVDPGQPDEQRVTEADPEKLGLLVTPNRLILEPGDMRAIRIVSINPTVTSDRVYRVKVEPQVGDVQTSDPGAANHGMAIKMLAAYDALVIVRPKGGKASIVATRDGTKLTLRNAGNSNALLYEGKACAATAKPADCSDLGARRLYPGNQWELSLPPGTDKIQFQEKDSEAGDPKQISF